MVGWREVARAEIDGLKSYFVSKHGWSPRVIEPADENILDLIVTLRSKRLGGRVLALRLRYQPDWQVAGRREAFVDPDNPSHEGLKYWPPAQNPNVRGINPQHNPPCICLRGAWGYHSVLHADQPMEGTTLLGFLLELQAVLDE
jgi:hypothetical protein